MTKPAKPTPKSHRLIVNGFGFLAYLHTIMLWAWVMILYLPLFLESETTQLFLGRAESAPAEPSQYNIPLPVALLIAGVTTVVMIVILVLLFWRMPRTIGRTGQKLVTKSATAAVPVVTHHKKLSSTQRVRLIERITWVVKLIIIVLPLLINLASFAVATPLPLEIVWTIAICLAIIASCLFGLQALFARMYHVPAREVW